MTTTSTTVPPAIAPSRSERRRLVAAGGPAALAAALAALAWLLGLHGTDLAAQVYRVEVFRRHGFVLWSPGWYAGGYPLGYSVLAPALGATLGIGPALVISAAAAAWCFDRLSTGAFGRRPAGSWYFAAATLVAVLVGQYPYLAGEALALAATLAATRRRWWLAAVLGAGAGLFSPVAAAFLVMAAGVWACFDAGRRRSLVAAGVGAAVAVGAVALAFPGDGPFPFYWAGLVVVEALCVVVLSPLVPAPRPVRAGAAVYGLATLASFLVANPLGGNAARFAGSLGVPLAACLLTRPSFAGGRALAGRKAQAVGLLALVPFAVWEWAPATAVTSSLSAPAADTAAFYRPLVAQIEARSVGGPVRAEVVPTREHWESAYVGPSVALARGWERQLDVRDNPIFYRQGRLDAATYLAWLRQDGVTWVALADAPLDYAGQHEAALLRRGEPGLTRVWSSSSWTLWRVDASPGLLSGPGHLVALEPDLVVIHVHRAGTLVLRARFMRYWTLADGRACVAESPRGWTDVDAKRPGTVVLRASLLGDTPAACPAS